MDIRELIEAEIVRPPTYEDREIIAYYWKKFMETYGLHSWNNYQFFYESEEAEKVEIGYDEDEDEVLNNECRKYLTYTILDTISGVGIEIDTIEQIYEDIAYVFNNWYNRNYSVVEDFKEFVFSEIDKDIEFENTLAEYNV